MRNFRSIFIVFIVLFTLFICACGGDGDADSNSSKHDEISSDDTTPADDDGTLPGDDNDGTIPGDDDDGTIPGDDDDGTIPGDDDDGTVPGDDDDDTVPGDDDDGTIPDDDDDGTIPDDDDDGTIPGDDDDDTIPGDDDDDTIPGDDDDDTIPGDDDDDTIPGDDDDDNTAFEIIDVYWWAVNSPEENGVTCSYGFMIEYDGDDPDKNQIDSIRIYYGDAEEYWEYQPDNDAIYDFEDKTIGDDWAAFSYPQNGHLLPLGEMTARIDFKDGAVAEQVFYTYEPNANGQSDKQYKYVYSEDYKGSIENDYAPMPRRAFFGDPNPSSSNAEGSDFTLYFGVNDPTVANVRLLLYSNDSGNLVEAAISEFLVGYDYDTDTEVVSSALNGGEFFRTTDTPTLNNNIAFLFADEHLFFSDGFTGADVTDFAVVLNDSTYSYYSFSSTHALKK